MIDTAISWCMMTSSNGNIFRVTGPLCGEFTVPVNSPHKGKWRGALMFSLICVWIKIWVNNREAGDLRRHRCHYDVTVMVSGITDQRMMTLYHGKAFRVTGPWGESTGSPRISTRVACPEVFFDININKLSNKKSSCWWFKTPQRSCGIIKMRCLSGVKGMKL